MMIFRVICSTVGLNEQSLRDEATKTLKYVNVYHQGNLKFDDKDSFHDVKFTYSSLSPSNIQFRFDVTY